MRSHRNAPAGIRKAAIKVGQTAFCHLATRSASEHLFSTEPEIALRALAKIPSTIPFKKYRTRTSTATIGLSVSDGMSSKSAAISAK